MNEHKEITNINQLLGITTNIAKLPFTATFNKSEKALSFLRWVSIKGFANFATYLSPEDLDDYNRLTKTNKKKVKDVYFNDHLFNDEETNEFFAEFIRLHLNSAMQSLNFHIEVVSSRFSNWHDDIQFTIKKDQIEGVVLWFFETHGNVIQTINNESMKVKTNHVYYLNDAVEHRLIPPKGRKRPPAKFVVIKFSMPKN